MRCTEFLRRRVRVAIQGSRLDYSYDTFPAVPLAALAC